MSLALALPLALSSLALAAAPARASMKAPLSRLPDASFTTPVLAEMRVTTAVLNVRAASSTNAAVVGRLQAGDSVTPLSQSADGRWWQIRFNGRTAYIWSAHTVQAQAQPIPAGDSAAASYGPLRATDATANRHFDFRTISSAEVQRLGDQLYMLYEGVRGPGPGDAGDTQFALGLARTKAGQVDGPWETYPSNPLLVDLPGNVGLGHADLLVLDGKTLLFTSLDGVQRARLGLVWITPK